MESYQPLNSMNHCPVDVSAMVTSTNQVRFSCVNMKKKNSFYKSPIMATFDYQLDSEGLLRLGWPMDMFVEYYLDLIN